MKRVFSTSPWLLIGLLLLSVSGALSADGTLPASYVKPGTDLSAYTMVLVKPLNMDNIEVLKPSWEQDSDETWTLDLVNKETIQDLFMEAMHNELESNGGYKLVSQAGPDVMRIEVELLSITPYVKPGTKSSDSDHKISTLGSGDLVFSAEFRDSNTRELLILVEGERPIGDEYRELSPENHIKNVKNMFTKWGKRVREALDKAHNI